MRAVLFLALSLAACTGTNGARSLASIAEETDAGTEPDVKPLPAGPEVPAWRTEPHPDDGPEEVENATGATLAVVEPGEYFVGGSLLGRTTQPLETWEMGHALLVQTTEATWGQYARLGLARDQMPEDEPWRPADFVQIVNFANAMSQADGLEPCYPDPETWRHDDGREGFLMPRFGAGCEGYRLPTEEEWVAMLADHSLPADFPSDNLCPAALGLLSVCYACTCANGTRAAGFSQPNRLGLRDMLGNRGELVHVGDGLLLIERGGDFTTQGQAFADPRLFREVGGSTETTGVRFVRDLK